MSADPGLSLSPENSTPEVTKQERQWAMYAHVSAPVFCIVGLQVQAPLWCFAAPLVIYLLKRNESAFVARHAKEAFNFTFMIVLLSAALFFGSMQLAIYLQAVGGAASLMWMILTTLLAFWGLSLYAIAAIKALDGQEYRYPFVLRLMR